MVEENYNKMKNRRRQHTVGTVPKFNKTKLHKETKLIPPTHILVQTLH